MEKIAYIMRGLPGSGKSDLAKQLAGKNGVIHSPNDYFIGEDGEYHFDPALSHVNFAKNFGAFCESLRQGIEIVVCDNTNPQRAHFMPYIIAAEEAGYRVAIVEIPHPEPTFAAYRSVHQVPVETIEEMISYWEP